jgi:hypothetical protein
MINPLFEKLLILWEVNNIAEIKKIKQNYFEFINIYKTKKFLNWKDIIKKYPKLEWVQIWEKLEMLNDEIMIGIKNEKKL